MRPDRRKDGRQKCLLRQPARLCGISHKTLVGDYLAQLGTSKALAVWLIYASGDHRDLLTLSVDIDGLVHTQGVDYARRSYAAVKLLAKADFLDLSIDRAQVAIDGGKAAERENAVTNQRLRELRSDPSKDPEFNSILYTAARLVARLLGPLYDSIDHQGNKTLGAINFIRDHGWTPGRTSAVDSAHRSPPHKYQAQLEVSASALPLAEKLVNSSPMWAAGVLNADGPCCVLRSAFSVVNHNTAITVPKNAKTDRLICYEPHINIRLQRSVGEFLAHRLKRVGINLGDQSPNQRYAREGSLSGKFATLDLSKASDTLSFQLVLDLLPIDWVEFLDQLRSRYTLWPDGLSLNEKFSSMGNGFTFELETICFWALCVASSSNGWALVYGDDIVVDSADYDMVCSALSKAGFTVNLQKSFGTGKFRESCGEDYWSGVSFTAPHLDHLIEDVEAVVKFHNQVFAWLLRDHWPHPSWGRMLRRWRKTVNDGLQSVGMQGVPLGPYGSGEGHFAANFDEACPNRHPGGWDGYVFHSIVKRFPRGLVTLSDGLGNVVKTLDRFTKKEISSWALLSSALGPRGSRMLEGIVQGQRHTSEKRSLLFAREWPSVTYSM